MKVILASPTIFFLSLRFAVSPPCRCPSVLHLFPILFAIIVYNCLSVYFSVLIFCCYFAFHFVEGEVAAVKIICLKIVTKSKIYWVRLWNCMERCLLSCTVSAWSKFWFIIVSVFFSAFCWCFLPRIKSTYFLPVWIRLKISVVSERSFFFVFVFSAFDLFPAESAKCTWLCSSYCCCSRSWKLRVMHSIRLNAIDNCWNKSSETLHCARTQI